MRIDDKFKYGVDKLDSNKAQVKKEKPEAGFEGKAAESDSLQISARAKDAVSLSSAVKDAPEIREQKVAELKEQIANGTYDISGKTVAEKIVNTAINGLF